MNLGRRSARFAVAILAVALVVACSSGGGGGDDGGGGVVSAGCLSYAPAGSATSGTVVGSNGSGSSCGLLALDILVTDVTDVFAADFDVQFNPSLVGYDGYSGAGSFLGSDGATVDVVDGVSQGRVTVGITRSGTSSGIDSGNSGLLVTLFFRSLAGSGAGSLTFPRARLLGSETPPVEKPGVTWSGGMLSIQ